VDGAVVTRGAVEQRVAEHGVDEGALAGRELADHGQVQAGVVTGWSKSS
jgi:hypothetical protein